MKITWRVISGEGEEGMGEKVQGIRSIIGRHKVDREVREARSHQTEVQTGVLKGGGIRE